MSVCSLRPMDYSSVAIIHVVLMVLSAQALNLTSEGYDHHLRPLGITGGPVVVGVSLFIQSIYEVDEKEMNIAMEVMFRAAWNDSRLVIPMQLFKAQGQDISQITLNSAIIHDAKIWLPDPIIDGAREIDTAELLQPFSGVRLSSNGELLWGQMFIINLRCAMFFDKFPFDTQICPLNMASYFYASDDMLFNWDEKGISASPNIDDALTGYKFTFSLENVTSCSTEDYINDEYPCLKSVMTFTRRYRSHLMAAYFPSVVFVLVAWASFFWPAGAIPARTALIITTLLATISLYVGVRQITPPTNYTRAIDNWFFACIVAVASTLFQYAIILRIRKLQVPKKIEKKQNTSPTAITPSTSTKSSQEKDSNKVLQALNLNTSRGTGSDQSYNTGSAKGPHYWKQMEYRVEQSSRILYLAFFIVFNLAYWIFYL